MSTMLMRPEYTLSVDWEVETSSMGTSPVTCPSTACVPPGFRVVQSSTFKRGWICGALSGLHGIYSGNLRVSQKFWDSANRPISVHRFPRRALTLCPQHCMGIQSGARFPARSADALPATLYGHFTQAIYRNRPISLAPVCPCRL